MLEKYRRTARYLAHLNARGAPVDREIRQNNLRGLRLYLGDLMRDRETADGQILVSPRVHAAVEELVVSTPVNDLELKGFSHPVTVHNIVGLNEARLTA